MAIRIQGETIITDGNESGNSSSVPLWDNHLLPSGTDWDLGKAAYKWKNLWIDEKANIGGNCDIDIDLNVGGNIDAAGHIDAGTWIEAANYKIANKGEVISADTDATLRHIRIAGINSGSGNIGITFDDSTPHIIMAQPTAGSAIVLDSFTIQDGKFQTVTLDGSRYCPELASWTRVRWHGYQTCQGTHDYSPTYGSGTADPDTGWICHYQVADTGNHLYFTTAGLYDLNCLGLYQPAYRYELDYLTWNGIGE